MVAKGWLLRHETSDLKKIYGVDGERMEEIKGFMNDFQSGTETNKKRISNSS